MADLFLKEKEKPISLYKDRRYGGDSGKRDDELKRTKTLYVGNLSFYTTEEQIFDLFSKVGEIRRIIMGLDRYKKTPCGFCFIEYYRRCDTEKSVNFLSGTRLDERLIRVDYDVGFSDGRQYGRGRSGGQVRDEHRVDYDPGRGGFGKNVAPQTGMSGMEMWGTLPPPSGFMGAGPFGRGMSFSDRPFRGGGRGRGRRRGRGRGRWTPHRPMHGTVPIHKFPEPMATKRPRTSDSYSQGPGGEESAIKRQRVGDSGPSGSAYQQPSRIDQYDLHPGGAKDAYRMHESSEGAMAAASVADPEPRRNEKFDRGKEDE